MPQESWQPAPPPYPGQQPPVVPPPQMPPTPYSNPTPPLVTLVPPELAPQYIKPHRRWLRVLLVIVLLAVIGGGSGYWYNSYRTSPNTVFNRAFGASLSTKQITETTADATITYDVSNPRNPRISTLTTKNLGADTYVKGYGSLQNTYIDYASNPGAKSTTPTNLLDQWIQVRDAGTLPTDAALTPLLTISDPRFQLLSPWMYGNFASKDRSNLQTLAKNAKLYSYDSKKVSKTTLNGRKTYVYNLTIDGTKLATYESKAGELYGIPAADIAANTKALSGATVTAKLYVDASAGRVVRLDTTVNGLSSSATYSNYNTAKVPGEPTAAMTYDDYLNRLGQE